MSFISKLGDKMEFIGAIIFLVVIGGIFLLPLIGAFAVQRVFGGSRIRYYVGLNALFAAWAAYDIKFTYHYPHGPNSLFIIFPGFITFAMFYLFVVPRMAPQHADEIKRARYSIAAVNIALFTGACFVA